MKLGISLLVASFFYLHLQAGEPVLRVERSAKLGLNFLRNGGFEQSVAGKPSEWNSAPDGFAIKAGQGRNGSNALFCENNVPERWTGLAQTIVLNSTRPVPVVVRGWSRAKGVSGSSDSDYSIYVDVVYTDGTSSWGHTARFRTGTHDWERREVVIMPEMPIRSLRINCLLRKHSGAVWFDDISVEQMTARGSALIYEDLPVLLSKPGAERRGEETDCTTRDGLKLKFTSEKVVQLEVDNHALGTNSELSGFLARDVAEDSDVYSFEQGECRELGLKLRTTWRGESNHIVIEGQLSDLRGKDRAVTVTFGVPLEGARWRWGDDIRNSRPIQGKGEYVNSIFAGCGSTGMMGLYPLAPMYGAHEGVALALDMGHPAQYRLGYNAGTRQLFISYDFALVPETKPLAGTADFRFVLFRFDPQWGFRSAFQKLTEIFPEYFVVRSREQGIWMPFTDVSTVQAWEDFGFRYHEGHKNGKWDDAHNILTFRYTEPMTWWMRMPKGVPRINSEALRIRDELARGTDEHQKRMAQVSQVAGMLDEAGEPCLSFRNEPWCDGAVWSLNPNPALPSGSTNPDVSSNAATIYWNSSVREKLYGPGREFELDGEYLDSLEGYVTADLNFRLEHFQYATVPLTFDKETRQPALFKGLAVAEFTRWLSKDVHQLKKLMFANSVPDRFSFLCPWLDVMGTETDWLREGRYTPPSGRQMDLWRTMSGKKPYLLLMNTDYNAFTPDMVERYFQRSLFYGMFPSMFSHNAAENPYWQNPKWYNRDRPLFKKYLPLIKQVAEAGWEPVTLATSDNPKVLVERFGPDANGQLYFTILNDSNAPQFLNFKLDDKALPTENPVRELVTGNGALQTLAFSLPPQQVRVLSLHARKSQPR